MNDKKEINTDSSINQKILGDFVAREIIMNATTLISDLQEWEKFDYDEIENFSFYVCSECGGTMKELFEDNSFPMAGVENPSEWFCQNCDHKQKEEPDLEYCEVYEWWFVTDWMFNKLKDKEEVVFDSPYGKLWGRQATGQAILLDGVIASIAKDLEILEGQSSDWSKK